MSSEVETSLDLLKYQELAQLLGSERPNHR